MEAYSPVVEDHMQALYRSLSEKDRRRYAAVEAEKLGRGGTEYIAKRNTSQNCSAVIATRFGKDARMSKLCPKIRLKDAFEKRGREAKC